jgi:hypothetical protein
MLEIILAIWLQTVFTNPRTIQFTCVDHGLDTAHEIDIVNAQGTVVQTLQVGDQAPIGIEDGLPLVQVAVNVMPVAMGEYTFVVRALAGTISSEPSLPSDVWRRAPGQPGKPRAGG